MSSLTSSKPVSLLHPALLELLRYQGRARLLRLVSGFGTPQRFVLSCVGLFLAAIWLGNVAVSVLMREATEPVRFLNLVSLGFTTYALWHVVRNAVWRPEAGIHWTKTEQEFLGGAPFSRRELIGYRFTSILTAASMKAVLISLLMLPDIHIWPAALVGTILAMLMLDLIRMTVELVFHGVSNRTYAWIRGCVLTLAGGCLAGSLISMLCAPGIFAPRSTPIAVTLLAQLFHSAVDLRNTLPGLIVEAPFRPFVSIVTTHSLASYVWVWLAVGTGMVTMMAWLVLRLDQIFRKRLLQVERQVWSETRALDPELIEPEINDRPLVAIPRWGGIYTVAWRQWITAKNYWASLLVALAPLAILSVLPLAENGDPVKCFINVVGGLVFFAFIMMPSVFKLDFRRDLDHMLLLKMLPLRSSSVVIGQLAVPVVLATVFQIAVLLGVALVRPISPLVLACTCGILLPINVLVFALDNLIFVLYPYRAQQEGLEVFIRAILILTGKGLLFAAALVFVLLWSSAAQWIGAEITGANGPIPWQGIFAAGLFAFYVTTASVTTWLLANAFGRFDPGQDVPA